MCFCPGHFIPCVASGWLYITGVLGFHCTVIPSVSPREISEIPLTLQLFFFVPGNLPPADTLHRIWVEKAPRRFLLSATAATIMWGLQHVHICSLHIWSKDTFSVNCKVRINKFFCLFFFPNQIYSLFSSTAVIHWKWGGLSHLSAQLSATTPPAPAGDKHAPKAGEAERPPVRAWWELMGHNAEVRNRFGSACSVTDGWVKSYCGVTYPLHLRTNKPGQNQDNDEVFCLSFQLGTEWGNSIPAEIVGVPFVFGQKSKRFLYIVQ